MLFVTDCQQDWTRARTHTHTHRSRSDRAGRLDKRSVEDHQYVVGEISWFVGCHFEGPKPHDPARSHG